LVSRVPKDNAYGPISIQNLADWYIKWAARFNLDVRVLWAQALYETGGFRYGGDVKAEWFNLCGLRLPDGSGYYHFSCAIDGVTAHVAHLAVHALPNCPNNWLNACLSDPKHPLRNKQPYHWHDMTVVGDLEKGDKAWCPSAGYAEAICRVWNRGI
jgi:hypothetical protein